MELYKKTPVNIVGEQSVVHLVILVFSKADASSTQVVRPIRLLGSGAMDAILIRRRTISTFFMEIIV